MDNQTDSGAGAGSGADPLAGSQSGAGAGNPAGQQGSGNGGGGGQGFNQEELTPQLRNLSPTQINDLFETMARGLHAAANIPVAHANSAQDNGQQQPPAPPKPALTKEGMREMLDPNSDKFDPMSAFNQYVEQTYGPVIGDINQRAVRGVLVGFRQEFDDFNQYEEEIIASLRGVNPTQINERLILANYFAAKGMRQTQKEKAEKAKNKGTTTLAPTPTPPAPPAADLSQWEKEAARKMFPGKQDPEAEYKKYLAMDPEEGGAGLVMKVPTGGGKRE